MGHLGAVLRALREDASMTQEELANRAGLSVRTVSDVERGLRRRLYRDTAERLADALDLAADQRAQFVDLARGRTADVKRDLDAEFKRRFVAWHVDRVSSLADRVGQEETWFAVLDADEANLSVALRWADEAADAESLLLLGAGLFRYWQARGALKVGREWLERGLRVMPPAGISTRMAGLWGLAWLAYQQGDEATAADCARELACLSQEAGDPSASRNAATVRGIVALANQDVDRSLVDFEMALGLARDLDDHWLVATSALNLGIAHYAAGDTAKARQLIGEALRAYEDVGDERFRARCLGYMGLAALCDGDTGRGESLYGQSLVIFEEFGEAKGIAESLTGLATAAAIRGLPMRAAQLAGAAEHIRESFDGRALPVERRLANTELARVRDRSDSDSWTAAWISGRALRQDEAITAALDIPPP
jgi:transcriptional regulator with XRE-family HTH domain